ncbi:YeeE/YedE family protein [Candidatus Aerophobetes bacterium]|nr:YeeE/YedE family protein [Candidatus Aerophobetes bacterium]
MLKNVHSRKGLQLVLGLFIGIAFGFLLQKGGVTNYNIIIGQLLLIDFTVVKVMLTAVLVGMIGIYGLRSLGLVILHPKPGSLGASVVGGLIFGVGFGLLGYCPGTVAGAVGQGSLDALFGGVVGMLLGTGLFAAMYPMLNRSILQRGSFGTLTLPELSRVHAWVIVIPLAGALLFILLMLERAGF